MESLINSVEKYPGIAAVFKPFDNLILAGGPVILNFLVKNNSNKKFYLAAGGDRSRLRPAFFSFDASFKNGNQTIIPDPFKNSINIGGPVSIIEIKQGESYTQTILLNQFLSLDMIYYLLEEGHKGVLTITCHYPLPEAYSKEDALNLRSNNLPFEQILKLEFKRDDSELKKYIQSLTDSLRNNWHQTYSVDAELILSKLICIRLPLVKPYIESLENHPNQIIKNRIINTLDLLDKNFDTNSEKQ